MYRNETSTARRRARALTVEGIVLAAGGSVRFGVDNKLLHVLNGQPIIRLTVQAYVESLERVIVVIRPDDEPIARALEGLGAEVVSNPLHELGMSTSLHSGLAGLRDSTEATVIGVADQPLLSAGVINVIVEHWLKSRSPIIVPYYAGRPGNPALYARSLFDGLMAVTGDVGGRPVRDAHDHLRVDVKEWWRGMDVDTGDDIAGALRYLAAPSFRGDAPILGELRQGDRDDRG